MALSFCFLKNDWALARLVSSPPSCDGADICETIEVLRAFYLIGLRNFLIELSPK